MVITKKPLFSVLLLRNFKMPKVETWHASAAWHEDDGCVVILTF